VAGVCAGGVDCVCAKSILVLVFTYKMLTVLAISSVCCSTMCLLNFKCDLYNGISYCNTVANLVGFLSFSFGLVSIHYIIRWFATASSFF
jgi:hypothetical protein